MTLPNKFGLYILLSVIFSLLVSSIELSNLGETWALAFWFVGSALLFHEDKK